MTFTVGDDVVPKWVKTVLRRVHTNLGHPTNEALVRHLAQAGATGQALLGAKSLKCAVCERTRPPRQPRPSKAIQSRRFNDRVFMDIIYPKNISGDTFIFLNLLDDASTYQVLDRLEDRREDTVVKALIQGWFRFFGHPDCLVLDAEGAFRGFRFENLVSQAGIKIRFVPPDAHYQLGKAERHGATAKWMMRRLVNQFAACTGDEMTSLANMSMFAKNTLVRRCGASPAQWVYGRQPKIPAALLSEPEAVEAKQSMENSDAYLQIEMARHEAIKCFADFEFDQALRKAMLRKGRPFRGPLEVGQKIAYYRYRNLNDGEGTVEGYRQGMIIGLDPGPSGSVWIRNNRGRVVQASREQVRSVEGEEMWTPSTDDLRSLKDSEIDLSQKHALAFDQRGPPPSQQQDRRVHAHLSPDGEPMVSHEPLQQQQLLPVPVPIRPTTREQFTETNQDGHGEDPHASKRSSTIAEPVLYLPPTPAVAPETPVPSLPPVPEAIEDEPNTRTVSKDSKDIRSASKTTDQTLESQLKIMDAPLALAPPAEPGASSSSQGRGTKREADIDITALQDTTLETMAAAAPEPSQEAVSLFLMYCKQCGTTKPNETTDKASSPSVACPRCFNVDFVDEPELVTSWFDEVEEMAAFERKGNFVFDSYYKTWLDPHHLQTVGSLDLPRDETLQQSSEADVLMTSCGRLLTRPPKEVDRSEWLWSVAHQQSRDQPWMWTHIFETIDVDPASISDYLSSPPNRTVYVQHGKNHVHRRRKFQQQPDGRHFRRHGRHCVFMVGWDGTEPGMHPAFIGNNFFHNYLMMCDEVAQERFALEPQLQTELAADINLVRHQGVHDVLHTTVTNENHQASIIHSNYEQVTQLIDSSDDEDDKVETTAGRAAKQALKREVPWKSISYEDWPKFCEALKDEWKEWQTWSSCEQVHVKPGEVDPKLIMRSRVCYRWKPKDGGKWFKPKARIVILGFSDPHLPLLTRDAPVLARTSFMLILQWAACHNVSLHNGDCKSAFLQGLPDDERPTPIFMKPPQDEISLEVNPEWREPGCLYRLSAPVYGQANAPRRWFLFVVETVKAKTWEQHSLDPCCFLFRHGGAVVALLGVHVDDIIICCLPDFEYVLKEIHDSFVWGSEWEKDDFIFVGQRIQRQSNGGFTIDQTHYVADISKTKINHPLDEPLAQHPELVTEFRSGIGSVQWLAGTTRGDLAAYMSPYFRNPTKISLWQIWLK